MEIVFSIIYMFCYLVMKLQWLCLRVCHMTSSCCMHDSAQIDKQEAFEKSMVGECMQRESVLLGREVSQVAMAKRRLQEGYVLDVARKHKPPCGKGNTSG